MLIKYLFYILYIAATIRFTSRTYNVIESAFFVQVCAEVINATLKTSFDIDYIAEDNTASSVGKCLIAINYLYNLCYAF